MSQTTNSFQFGVKGKQQWIGEDILIIKSTDPIYYSAIAVGRVIALEISKNDMVSKLPMQFIRNLEAGCVNRKEWFIERLHISKLTAKMIVKQGEETQLFENEE